MGHVIHLAPQREHRTDSASGSRRISAELLDMLLAARLTHRELRIMLAVARVTQGRGRKYAAISYRRLAGMCGIDPSDAGKTVHALVRRGLLMRREDLYDAPGLALADNLIQQAAAFTDAPERDADSRATTLPAEQGKTPAHEGDTPTFQGEVPAELGVLPTSEGGAISDAGRANAGKYDASDCSDNENNDLTGNDEPEPMAHRGEAPAKNEERNKKKRKNQRKKEERKKLEIKPPIVPRSDEKILSAVTCEDSIQAQLDFADENSVGAMDVSVSSSQPEEKPTRATSRRVKRETKRRATTVAFERFWAAYPKKRSRQQALKAFAKLAPDEALLDTMLEALLRWCQTPDWLRDGGQYVPNPATWLNAQGWLDEVPDAAYTPAQASVIAAYNRLLSDGADWPLAVDVPYSARRAGLIDAFLGFSDKPNMPERYFEHCVSAVPRDDTRGFDWLISCETFLRVREGLVLSSRQSKRNPG